MRLSLFAGWGDFDPSFSPVGRLEDEVLTPLNLPGGET